MFNKVMNYIKVNVDDELEPIYKGGKKENGILKMVGRHFFILECLFGQKYMQMLHGYEDMLKTLHYNDSIMNDVILALTSENSNILTNEEKNIINRNLFIRGAPRTISEEVDVKMKGTVAEEIQMFNRLIKEGEFRNHLPYYNSNGELKHTRSWALCSKDYNYKNNDVFFLVPKEEVNYFNEHGHFPLRKDNGNSKLGKNWLYLAFQLAWTCSGNALGYCQCPNECYAKHMETTYKNVRDRVLRSMNAWQNTSRSERAEFYTNWIINGDRKGIRFCDTGDVPNQETLDDIFELVREITYNLTVKGVIKLFGRFYIYSTRHDLDWSKKPSNLILNASNEELFNKVPDANWFRVIDSFDNIPEEYKDPDTLHICNCNCKACDYCATCTNTIIWEVLG